MNRTTVGVITVLSLVATLLLSGCASDPAPPQQVAPAQPSVASAPAVAQPGSRPSDIQSLQQDRKQDAQVIGDAQKAVGVMGH